MARLALQVLYKLLGSYEFVESDFVDQFYEVSKDQQLPMAKSPGYTLLEHLMNNSQLLRKVNMCSLLQTTNHNSLPEECKSNFPKNFRALCYLSLHIFSSQVLYVLDEARRRLSTPGQPYPDSLPHAALLCLKLVEAALAREERFFELLRTYNRRVLVSPLHELLLEINPRTGKPDYMVTVAE